MKRADRMTTAQLLELFNAAMDRRWPVTITALKEERDERKRCTGRLVQTVRTVETYDVETTDDGHLVLKVMDRESGAPRSFRLDRIMFFTVHRRSAYALEAPEPTTDPDGQIAPVHLRLIDARTGGQLSTSERLYAREMGREDAAYWDDRYDEFADEDAA